MTERATRPRSPLADQRGQGLTEYIIIVVLIAIAAIGVVTIFGDGIRELFGGSNAERTEGRARQAPSGDQAPAAEKARPR